MSRRRRGATRVTTISGRSPLTGRGLDMECSVHTLLSCNKYTITNKTKLQQLQSIRPRHWLWHGVHCTMCIHCSVATSIHLQNMAIVVIRPWLRNVALCVQQYVRRCGDVEVLWQQNSRIAQCFAGNPPKLISPPMSTPYQGLPRHCLLW